MTGFEADVDAIMSCRTRLAEIQQRAAAIADLAEDANPEWYVWGALGAPFAALYWSYADDIHKHLGMMGEALRDRVDALDCTAQAYRETDERIDAHLRRIGVKLEGGA
ncbi:hypothetical protein [Micromonospora globbae]|uniref:hypothetical protein n=1 Tax=Micromonospora globbae TaxID=1894969 RepID=UPI0037AAFAC3